MSNVIAQTIYLRSGVCYSPFSCLSSWLPVQAMWLSSRPKDWHWHHLKVPSPQSTPPSRLIHTLLSMTDATHPTLLFLQSLRLSRYFTLSLRDFSTLSVTRTHSLPIKTSNMFGSSSVMRPWSGSVMEVPRNAEIRKRLTRILQLPVHEEPNTDKTCADGVHMIMVGGVRIPILIMELKRELGDGGCDPTTQAAIAMRRSWIQQDVSLFMSCLVLFSQSLYAHSELKSAISVAALLWCWLVEGLGWVSWVACLWIGSLFSGWLPWCG